MLITCPRCPARWTGLKLEHCPAAGCHLTFSSTRAGDRHLVDMDDRGWSRHLTPDEMRALRTNGSGDPWHTSHVNSHGTVVWVRYRARTHPEVAARDSDGVLGGCPVAGT